MNKYFLPLFALFASIIMGANLLNSNWYIVSKDVQIKFNLPDDQTDGSFTDLSSDIVFFADKLEQSKITATVAVKSIQTGDATRDEHLRSKDFFDEAKFPTITYVTHHIHKSETGYSAHGDLTIRGIKKHTDLSFTFTQEGKKGMFKGSMKINTIDFGIAKVGKKSTGNVEITLNIPVTSEK